MGGLLQRRARRGVEGCRGVNDRWLNAGLHRIPQSLEVYVGQILDDPEFLSKFGEFPRVNAESISACLRFISHNRPDECADALLVIADALRGEAGTTTLRPVRSKRGNPVPRAERAQKNERDGRIAWHVWEQYRQFKSMDSAIKSASEMFKVSEAIIWTALHIESDKMDLVESIFPDINLLSDGSIGILLGDTTLLVEQFGSVPLPAKLMQSITEPSFAPEFGEFRNWLKSYSTAPKPQ